MIRICAGYERENGEKVHQRIRILGVRRPYLKLVRTDGWCPECAAAYREDAQRYHREHVDALRASRIARDAQRQGMEIFRRKHQDNQGGGARGKPSDHCQSRDRLGAPLPADMRLKG